MLELGGQAAVAGHGGPAVVQHLDLTDILNLFVADTTNDPPVVQNRTLSLAEDTSVAGFLTGTDPENDALTFAVTTTAATHGTVTVDSATGAFTYTPAANYFGTASFTYTATDTASNVSNTGTVTVTVTEVNDAPTAVDDTTTTAENTTLVFAASTLTANDNAGPNEGTQTLTVTGVAATATTHGTVVLNADNTVTYTPDAYYHGPASFSYTITDNGTTNGANDFKSATSTVNVTVTEVNQAPTANPDTKTTAENATLTFSASDLTANDSAGPNEANQTLTVVSVTPTGNTNGTVTFNPATGNITYTPNANYNSTNGPASFLYTVQDNGTTNGHPAAQTAAAP